MLAEELASTPLPKGFDQESLVVRKFLLDLRSRLKGLPFERKRMLEQKVYGYHTNAGRNNYASRSRTTAGLVTAVNG